jgi:hypothetical protein
MTQPIEAGDIYKAIVNYVVSDETKGDAWELVAKRVNELATANQFVSEIVEELRKDESKAMKDFNLRTLPVAYRSAKSTALSAISSGISLTDEKGKVRPKSKVSQLVKKEVKATPRGRGNPAKAEYWWERMPVEQAAVNLSPEEHVRFLGIMEQYIQLYQTHIIEKKNAQPV